MAILQGVAKLADELNRRRTRGGWGFTTGQFASEPTALALLALFGVSDQNSIWLGVECLCSHQRADGSWPSADQNSEGSIWSTILAVNALIFISSRKSAVQRGLKSLLEAKPQESCWLWRLKFQTTDKHVRFDPTKYGWPWVPDTVSWVLPTSMALIALERAKRRGLVDGGELENRLRLGAEMLLDRVCMGGGWNAGNAVVYGVPLRPHVDATAIALAALRLHYLHPVVRNSLTWLLGCIQCPSAYSLAWLILAIDLYSDVRADITPALNAARDHLAGLIDDPHSIADTSTIALAALALGGRENPFEVSA